MRSLILSEVASLFLFLIAFSFIAHWDGGDEGWVPSGVIAVGGLAMIGIAWVRRRPVRGTTQASLVNVYRTQFFLSIGLAMMPADKPCRRAHHAESVDLPHRVRVQPRRAGVDRSDAPRHRATAGRANGFGLTTFVARRADHDPARQASRGVGRNEVNCAPPAGRFGRKPSGAVR
jgi:hypothetical protein